MPSSPIPIKKQAEQAKNQQFTVTAASRLASLCLDDINGRPSRPGPQKFNLFGKPQIPSR